MMDPARLRELLAQLHAELSRGESPLDGSSRELLQAIHDDIERVAAAPAPLAEEQERVRGRLQAAMLGFQTSHPQLATNLESTMNALSNLGL